MPVPCESARLYRAVANRRALRISTFSPSCRDEDFDRELRGQFPNLARGTSGGR